MARAAPATNRAIGIVSFLTANPGRGFTISEIVEELGMNIASAHSTLAALCDAGFVVRDPVHRTYVLGPALAVTGFAALREHPAIPAAVRRAEALAAEIGAEVGVSAVAGRDVIVLARHGPRSRHTTIGYPGDRAPLLAPVGAVFLAWAPEPAVAEWLNLPGLSDSADEGLRAALGEIRRRGFSVPLRSMTAAPVSLAMKRIRHQPDDPPPPARPVSPTADPAADLLSLDRCHEGDVAKFKTVAAPVFDPDGRVLLSMSVSGGDEPVPVAEIVRLGSLVRRAATSATREGRGRLPDD